jgi:metal transporter CNNM
MEQCNRVNNSSVACRLVLFPVAKPTALFLNWSFAPEGITLFVSETFMPSSGKHLEVAGIEVGRVQGIREVNFFDPDDIVGRAA